MPNSNSHEESAHSQTEPKSQASPVIGDPSADHYVPVTAVKGEIFEETMHFRDLGLSAEVLKGCEDAGFKHPTVTQARLMPPLLEGKDVMGQAKTGTGKTAAFGLPLLQKCTPGVEFQAIVLAPTRELAVQITAEIEELGRHTDIRAMTLFGGQSVQAQANKLERRPQIIVGTPGRVMDMLERGHLHFRNVRFAVLDEVDRMLDIGFREDIRKILDQTPRERQTMFVSATISPEIDRLSRKYLRDPEKIIVHSGSLTVSMVKQMYLSVNQWDKKRLLLHMLRHEDPGLTLIFCRLKRTVDELARGLNERGVESHAIHGDLPQSKRTAIFSRLKAGTLSVLIASDLVSRGIDVDGISHVINFDIPEDPEVYVHRIGRTARAGRGGVAWTFVTPEQGELLSNIENLINAEIPKLDYPEFIAKPAPEGYRAALPGGRREGGLQIARIGEEITAPGSSAPAPKAQTPKQGKYEATLNPIMPAQAAKVDESKFPGGIIPSKLPPKRLIRGFKTGR